MEQIYRNVAEKTGHKKDVIKYVIANYFRQMKDESYDYNYVKLCFANLVSMTGSWRLINNLLRNHHVKVLRENPNDEKVLQSFKDLWEWKQRIVRYEHRLSEANTKNRPWL